MRIFNGRGVFNAIQQYAVLFMLTALFGITVFAQIDKAVDSDSKSLGINYSTSFPSSSLLNHGFKRFNKKQNDKQMLGDFCIPLPGGGVVCF